MTELVRKISVTITLHPDDLNAKVMRGGRDLMKVVEDYWPTIGKALFVSPLGTAVLHWGGVTVEWSNHGLEEQAGEGDN
jgi:hypothetical protein